MPRSIIMLIFYLMTNDIIDPATGQEPFFGSLGAKIWLFLGRNEYRDGSDTCPIDGLIRSVRNNVARQGSLAWASEI
jgi:hypothetical protein